MVNLTPTDNTIPTYARVVNGVVTDYPITQEQLNDGVFNFNLEIHEITEGPKEPIDEILQKYETSTIVVTPYVIVSYKAVDKTMEDIIAELTSMPQPVLITDIPPTLLAAVVVKVKEGVQHDLDSFAKEKDYDSIASAISYKGSTVGNFNAEAIRCATLRDSTWNALNVYFGTVMSGTNPIPLSRDDIKIHLPTLTW